MTEETGKAPAQSETDQNRSMVIQHGLLAATLLNPPLGMHLQGLVAHQPACANDNDGEMS